MTHSFPLMLALLTPMASPPFGPGEELVFQVKAVGIKSGSAQFNVGAAAEVAGVSSWPIVMVARSEGVTELMYPVRDRFVSFWDPVRGLPVESTLTANEGGKHRTMSMRFHRGGDPHADVMISDAHDTRSFSQPMPEGAQDVQAAVYWLRTRPLAVGDEERVPIVAGKREWVMNAKVIQSQPLDTPAGHFRALLVRIETAFAGKLSSRGAIEAYFSDDPRHVPLRFDANLALGKMSAELVRFAPGETTP